MLEKLSEPLKRALGSDGKNYSEVVKNLKDQAQILPDEGTAKMVYFECRLMEHVLRKKIHKKKKLGNGALEMVDALEAQEQTTAKVKDYASEQGWDLSPVDEEVNSYLKNGHQK